MSLVEKYPHPGAAPPVPATSAPTKERFAYIDWVTAFRRHVVAKAVDDLTALPSTTPEQAIAAVLGAAYLEDRLSSHSPFGGLFG